MNARRIVAASSRRGLTLFEVVLALGIFLGAAAALSQLVSNGSRAAVRAQLLTEAAFRCESKLAELLSGVEMLQDTAARPFDDQPMSWEWSAAVSEGSLPDLLQVTVTVRHLREGVPDDVSFTLDRLVRDPQVFVDANTTPSVQTTP